LWLSGGCARLTTGQAEVQSLPWKQYCVLKDFCSLANCAMTSTLIVHCQWEDERAKERTDRGVNPGEVGGVATPQILGRGGSWEVAHVGGVVDRS